MCGQSLLPYASYEWPLVLWLESESRSMAHYLCHSFPNRMQRPITLMLGSVSLSFIASFPLLLTVYLTLKRNGSLNTRLFFFWTFISSGFSSFAVFLLFPKHWHYFCNSFSSLTNESSEWECMRRHNNKQLINASIYQLISRAQRIRRNRQSSANFTFYRPIILRVILRVNRF